LIPTSFFLRKLKEEIAVKRRASSPSVINRRFL